MYDAISKKVIASYSIVRICLRSKKMRLVTLIFITLFCVSNAVAQQKVNVTFIAASDMDTMSAETRGGPARVAAVVREERKNNPNAVFVFPGDIISPSVLSGFDKGKHMVDLLNLEPPDIFVPGNHEFDFGPDIFVERMKEGNFDKLATNTRQNGQPINGFKNTKMMTFGDLKVGFIGLTTDTTPNISSPGNITFLEPIATAQKFSKQLREQGADVVVAAVHTGMKMDFELMYKAGADIIISGHDHNLHIFYDGNKALIEAKEEGEYVVLMDVEFDIGESRGKRRVKWWPNFRIQDTAKVTPDPEVAAKVGQYEDTLSKELDVEIGVANVELDTRKAIVRGGETAFGNLVADAMRNAVDADVAVTNGGGIRGNKIYDAGTTLTRRDIVTELPFGNKTIKIQITGKQILEALENSTKDLPETGGQFLHVSNISFAVDSNKPSGQRISDVTVGGEGLNPTKVYTLATNDFLGRGGDGYSMFSGATRIIDAAGGKLMASDVIDYIIETGSINPKVEGRIKIK